MIESILIIIFFTVSLAFAAKISTSEGMVFEKIGDYAIRKNEEGKYIWKALLLCSFCMPSVYSIFGYFFYALIFGISDFKILFALPIVIGAGSLIHGLIWTVFDLLWAEVKQLNNE